jgi:hypothetical protein
VLSSLVPQQYSYAPSACSRSVIGQYAATAKMASLAFAAPIASRYES